MPVPNRRQKFAAAPKGMRFENKILGLDRESE
jgi:hypothetical protein